MTRRVKVEINKICMTTETVRTLKPDRQNRCFLVYSCIRSRSSQMCQRTHYGDIKAADFTEWLIDIGRVLPRVVHHVVMPSQASKYTLSDLSLKWHLNSLSLQIWVPFSFTIFIQTSAVALFIYFLVSQLSPHIECGGSCSDEALVLAVKWSICRYVCLHHRHLLTHSLPCSPDEQKRLIYTGFKDTAFSPIWLRFPGGCVFPFESQPNRLWWHPCVLHESVLFSCEKISTLCGTNHYIKWERTPKM